MSNNSNEKQTTNEKNFDVGGIISPNEVKNLIRALTPIKQPEPSLEKNYCNEEDFNKNLEEIFPDEMFDGTSAISPNGMANFIKSITVTKDTPKEDIVSGDVEVGQDKFEQLKRLNCTSCDEYNNCNIYDIKDPIQRRKVLEALFTSCSTSEKIECPKKKTYRIK